ncbi:MAG: hypothetical protein HQL07_08065 [Nitrospirae bacterium]|nr:hypothetical protein [Magnetococcales bacterium]HAT51356.1 hypothetical protein [Alphaproteobacteria bacterium]
MMPAHYFYLHVARVCLESRTGLSIASGLSEGGYDVLLVRDANGLPTIPGTAIAGVLRHLYQRTFPDGETETLFGTETKGDELLSRIHFSWGAVHDSHNQPIEGLLLGAEADKLEADPLLRLLAEPQPVLRDHVRINHRGAAEGSGKFDRGTLPPGCRFTLELLLWSENENDPCWERVLSLLYSPLFRLGGAVRRGLGAFKVVSIHENRFNLKDTEQFNRFTGLHRSLGSSEGLNLRSKDALSQCFTAPEAVPLCVTMTLKGEDFWRFGQGRVSFNPEIGRKPPDQLPLGIPKITWSDDGQARVVDLAILIPASAIKGALAHRFVFHLLRYEGRFLEEMETPDTFDPRSLKAVQSLFGWANDTDGDGSQGRVGRLLMDDLTLDLPARKPRHWVGRLTHNSIDRFSGGVRDGALFTEEMLFDLSWPFTLTIIDPHREPLQDPNLKKALADVLDDLATGQLSLGAGESKGHGIFTSDDVTWSDGGQWINGGRS